ncbi:MAG: efflux RND transporter periplasmic adaptor subunit, partial [Bacteroidota bacterium]|nr:efflux RND transporter periplasmic adaptor subunit [Bacteroidota bacterium]
MMRRLPAFTPAVLCLLGIIGLNACGNGDEQGTLYTGIIDANTVRISAETPGRVVHVAVDEGSEVAKGDPLVRLETERLDYQLTQSDARQSELRHQIASATARLRAARVQRDNLATRLERFRALLAEEAVTKQAVDDLATQLEAAEAEIAAAEAAHAALESKTAQLGAGENMVRKQLRDAEITSPLAGRVLVRYVDIGELLGVGSPVCEIANLDELWTRIYVPEPRLSSIALGQRVRIRVDGSDEESEGRISWISETAEF